MRYVILILFGLYLLGYVALRTTNAEMWEEDGHHYVIFPEKPIALYYAYRPLTYLDGALTGMRFHIGPHRQPDDAPRSSAARWHI